MKRRRLLAVGAILGGVLLLAAAGLVLTLRSRWFHEKVRERIVSEVEKASGAKAELGAFEFDWQAMEARVLAFTLHGREPREADPLFRADAIRVGLTVVSFLRRDVDLASLEIDKPQINILVAADGSTNLPVPPAARQHSRNPLEQVIALKLGRIDLRDGVVHYDSQTLPLDVHASSVAAHLDYETAAGRYVGRVSARPASIRTRGIRPFQVEQVEADVRVEGNGIVIPRAHVALRHSEVNASGSVDDLKNLRAAFAVKARGSLAELGPIVRSPLLPEGSGGFDGSVRLGGARPVEIAGMVHGQGLGYTYGGWTIRNATARARVHFTVERLELNDLRVDALQGTFRGRALLENLRRFRVTGEAGGFSLAQLAQGRATGGLPWSGTVSGPLEAEGVITGNGIEESVVTAQLAIAPAEGGIPISGSIDAAYRQREREVQFGPSWLQTPATRLNFEGSPEHRLHAGLVCSNLNDLLPALASFSENAPRRIPVELVRAGEARFEGWVTGSTGDPRIQGRASLGPLDYDGTQIDSLSGEVTLSAGRLEAADLSLAMGSLRLEGDGSIGLTDWTVRDNAALSAKFRLRHADIKSLLEQQKRDLPVRGVVDAEGTVSGALDDLHGSAKVQVGNLFLGDEHFDRGTADLRFDGTTLTVADGQLVDGAAKLGITGTWTRDPRHWNTGSVLATVSTTGFPLSRLEGSRDLTIGVEGAVDVKSTVAIRLNAGTARVTAADGRLTVRDLTYRKTALGSLVVTAATQGAQVRVTAAGSIRSSRLSGEGTLDLKDDYPGRGRLTLSRFEATDIEPFVAGQFPGGFPFRAALEAGATFDGALLTPEGIRALVRVEKVEIRPRERERLGPQIETPPDLVLRNAAPVSFAISRKGVSITSSEFVARNTDFFASGTLAFASKSPWDLKLKGKIDLAILDSFNRDIQAAGVSTLDATVRGSLAQPQVNGRMELTNASFYVRGVPNGIDKANGVVLFDRNRANVEKLTAQTGGGEISLGGFVGLGGDEIVYRLQAKASRVRVRYPEGVSTTVDADLNLTGTSSRSLLAGTVSVIRSGFTPRTDLGSILAQAGKSIPAPASPNEFLQGLQFDVRVETAPNVQFQTALTRDIQMEAALRLRGSPAKPVVLGTVNVNRGEIQFFGNKYTINRGEISFFNAAKIEPVVSMDLETRVRAVTVNINFAGPLEKLNVTYRSDPPLQSSEIIALLTVGRSPAATDPNMATGQQQTQGNQSLFQSNANSLLGQAVTAPVSSRLQRFFGVSRLKIDPQLTGLDNTPQARLTLEQQISKDVTLTYVTNLTRTQQQMVRLEWNLSQEWSVVAIRDENGVFGVDFQYRRRIH